MTGPKLGTVRVPVGTVRTHQGTPVKLRRLALVLAILGAGASWATTSLSASTPSSSGLPLFQFVNTGTSPLPWNAVSLQNALNHTTMVGGPHGAQGPNGGAIAYRTSTGDVAALAINNNASTQWSDFTTNNDVPAAGADPIPFYDPWGNVDLLYVDQASHVILVSPNEAFASWWNHLHVGQPWRPFVHVDLTRLTGALASNGLPSIQVAQSLATVAYRTSTNAIEVLRLSWSPNDPLPIFKGLSHLVTAPATKVTPTTTTTRPPASTTTTAPTTTTTRVSTTTTVPVSTTTRPPASTTTTVAPTTTTTLAPGAPAFASDPVVLPGLVAAFVTTVNNGNVVDYVNSGAAFSTWSSQNLTLATGAAKASGPLSLAYTPKVAEVAALSIAGAVELFSTNLSNLVVTPATVNSTSGSTTTSPPPSFNVVTPSLPTGPTTWTEANPSALATGAPPLSGTLALNITPSEVTIAGQAANWGDLFVLTNAAGTTSWSATDVSVTAGQSARTVSNIVTGLTLNGALTLYAEGVSSPPPQGVGIYAIPSVKWSQAIKDGWPIISETGGLGTMSSPWVGFTNAGSVASSPDFLLGQTIYNSHKRVTWLSFWTVSGPLANEVQSTSTYFQHGLAAGAWVASQIDAYRSLGIGLKPDWVIFDPEGYPDNHSHLDAPGGATNATLARYASYWAAMLRGWADGIKSVDPSLNAGVYASQSEYRNYQLSTSPLPVFMAVAFSGGGPVAVAGASGSNVRGFISFGAVCTPKTSLTNETQTLLNPPWAGQFNTLQFNYGVYCAPSAP